MAPDPMNMEGYSALSQTSTPRRSADSCLPMMTMMINWFCAFYFPLYRTVLPSKLQKLLAMCSVQQWRPERRRIHSVCRYSRIPGVVSSSGSTFTNQRQQM